VVSRHGISVLNRVWESPAALPSSAELRRPDDWVERIEQLPAAA
jgi:uncharacterized protein (DUF2342 family)